MTGLAEYIDLVPCGYPSVVSQWEAIPSAQIASFTPEGFQRSDCFGCKGPGLGDFQFTSPGGYFASGIDFTQWGAAEWLTALGGAYMVFSTVFATKQAVGFAREGRKRSASRRKKIKAAQSSRGFF